MKEIHLLCFWFWLHQHKRSYVQNVSSDFNPYMRRRSFNANKIERISLEPYAWEGNVNYQSHFSSLSTFIESRVLLFFLCRLLYCYCRNVFSREWASKHGTRRRRVCFSSKNRKNSHRDRARSHVQASRNKVLLFCLLFVSISSESNIFLLKAACLHSELAAVVYAKRSRLCPIKMTYLRHCFSSTWLHRSL